MRKVYLVFRRHCKVCEKEFQPERSGKICNKCKNDLARSSYKKYKDKHRIKLRAQNLAWAKNNIEKNREKARRYLWKKQLKFLIENRPIAKDKLRHEKLVETLRSKISISKK